MQILLISVWVAPALLYLAAWALGLRQARGEVYAAGNGSEMGQIDRSRPRAGRTGLASPASLLLLSAVLLHFTALYLAIAPGPHVRFGFAQILSATLWIGSLLLWFEPEQAHANAMRVMVLPVAALTAPLPAIFPGVVISGEAAGRALFVPHLMVGTLAYAVLFLALLHAVLMASAERRLRAVHPADGVIARLVDRLPPLLSMERVLFRLIALGFVLLTLTAVSGMFWSEAVFGRPFKVDHKTVFTLLAWAAFGTLLVGRWLWGWRGRTALRLTIAGFVIMLLGYAGSRFVLEVFLGRT